VITSAEVAVIGSSASGAISLLRLIEPANQPRCPGAVRAMFVAKLRAQQLLFRADAHEDGHDDQRREQHEDWPETQRAAGGEENDTEPANGVAVDGPELLPVRVSRQVGVQQVRSGDIGNILVGGHG
jgi:hypothetical protein